jgi:hypothetical protein
MKLHLLGRRVTLSAFHFLGIRHDTRRRRGRLNCHTEKSTLIEMFAKGELPRCNA